MTEGQKQSWEIPEEEVEWAELEKTWVERKENDSFLRQLEMGRQGLNVGLDNGLKNINTYLHGTHRGRYYLIASESGVGKTTLLDFTYLYSLWKNCKKRGIRLYVKYFSFELSAAEKKAKWVCQWVKRMYNVDLPPDYIMGRIDGILLTDEHLRMVKRGYGVVTEMMADIDLCDSPLHPTGMLTRILDHYEKIGTIVRDAPKEGKKPYIRGYIPNNPTDFTLVVVDHLALISPEHGAMETKAGMDRWSMYSVMLRNIFQCSIVNVQQFSTSMQDAHRTGKTTETAIAPQRLDLGDSRYSYRDCDVCLGLVKPVQFNLKSFSGFPLEVMGQYFIACYLMKNRYGAADRVFPLFMNPVSGMFTDLPLSPQDPALPYYIQEAQKIEALCQQFSSPQGTTQ